MGITPVGALLNPVFIANNENIMPGWRQIRPVQNADWSVNPELIAQLSPDLIVGGSDTDGQSLSSLAPFFGLRDTGRMEPMLDSLAMLARLLDREADAIRARHMLLRKLQHIASLGLPPKSAMSLYVVGAGRISSLGSLNSSVELVARICGPQSQKSAPSKGTLSIGSETLLEADPDVILFWYHDMKGPEATLAALARLPLWKDIRAVRDGAVLPINGWRHPTSHSVGTAIRFLNTVVSGVYGVDTPTCKADPP